MGEDWPGLENRAVRGGAPQLGRRMGIEVVEGSMCVFFMCPRKEKFGPRIGLWWNWKEGNRFSKSKLEKRNQRWTSLRSEDVSSELLQKRGWALNVSGA